MKRIYYSLLQRLFSNIEYKYNSLWVCFFMLYQLSGWSLYLHSRMWSYSRGCLPLTFVLIGYESSLASIFTISPPQKIAAKFSTTKDPADQIKLGFS